MIALAYAALWVFVFSVPWENVILIPGFGAISRVMGVMALGFALLAAVVTGRLRRWHLFHIAAFLFVMWAALDLFFFHAGVKIPDKFWTYVQLLLVLWMIWELAPSRRGQLGLLTAYVFGAYVAAVATILVYQREAGTSRRFAAEGFNTNDLAMILALAMPMAWYLGITYRQLLMRWICRAYLPLGLVALGMTGSRGGMLAGIVGLLIVPLTMTRLSPGRLATAMVMVGLSGALAVAYVPQTAVQRLASTRTEMEEGTLGGRLQIWRAGWYAFAQKPVMGYGTSSFKGAVTPWMGSEAKVAHNAFLSVLVEQGIIGFLFYSMMLVAVFLAVLELPLLERRFALVLLATLGIALLPLSWEDNKSTWVILAALLGLSQAYVAGRGAARPSPQRRPAPRAGTPMVARQRERLTAPVRRTDRDGTA